MKRKDADIAAVRCILLNAEMTLLHYFKEKLIEKGNQQEAEQLDKDAHEVWEVEEKLMKEKGDFSIIEVREKLPNNSFLKIQLDLVALMNRKDTPISSEEKKQFRNIRNKIRRGTYIN